VYEMGARLTELERARKPTTEKYATAFATLLGRKIKGDTFFQHLSLLFDVRDEIVHTKAQEYEISDDDKMLSPRSDKMMARLKSLGLTTDFKNEYVTTGLLGWISTPASARWACNTAVATVKRFIDSTPAGDFRMLLDYASSPWSRAASRGRRWVCRCPDRRGCTSARLPSRCYRPRRR
jgi:hypothetical protein